MILVRLAPWRSDWLWSIPLIVVTISFHAYFLGLLNRGVLFLLKGDHHKRVTQMLSVLVVGGSSLGAIVLHGLEAWMWALAYGQLGELGDRKGAMLFSLSVMTTVGGSDLRLDPGWKLMGTLEALDGWILFGLTAAFLFVIIQKVWQERP
jgi:hypothetical protein